MATSSMPRGIPDSHRELADATALSHSTTPENETAGSQAVSFEHGHRASDSEATSRLLLRVNHPIQKYGAHKRNPSRNRNSAWNRHLASYRKSKCLLRT